MKTILLVEDDFTTQKLLIDQLKKKGYSVLITTSGEEALAYTKARGPDLILLDIMLKGKINGFDYLESIKASDKLKNIPVIILTNLDSEERVAKEIGADEYLVKANTSIDNVVATITKHVPPS